MIDTSCAMPLRGKIPAPLGGKLRASTGDIKTWDEHPFLANTNVQSSHHSREKTIGYKSMERHIRHRLLVIEDDAVLADGISGILRGNGYSVHCLSDGIHAHDALLAERYDLVILDLGLPRMDGLELLQRLRARQDRIPVLIISARNAVEERVKGLQAGADGYLVKPFDLTEFEAHVESLLRRHTAEKTLGSAAGGPSAGSSVPVVMANGKPIDFTPREHDILGALFASGGKVVSKASLNKLVAAEGEDLSDNVFQVSITRLRKKLEGSDLSIRTIRGFGYLLQTRRDPESHD